MKKTFNILFFFILITPTFCQEIKNIKEIGLNIPSLIGKTLEIKGLYTNNNFFSISAYSGVMFPNKLQLSYVKIGDYTDDHLSSGVYFGFGTRFTPRKNINGDHFFMGFRLISGYFLQSAMPWEDYQEHFIDNIIPDDYYFINGRVHSKGIYFGFAGEIGSHFELKDKIGLDVGLEIGISLYESKFQVSKYYNRLPGIGVYHVKLIFCPYYIMKKNR